MNGPVEGWYCVAGMGVGCVMELVLIVYLWIKE